MAGKEASSVPVLVVDDHRTFAEAVALALGLEKGLTASVASSGAEAIEATRRDPPSVTLLDVEMPGMSGIDVLRRLAEINPEGRVLVLSGHDDDLVRARAFEAGATGYLSKDTPIADLAEAVQRASRGEPVSDPEQVASLLRRLHHRRHTEATERQRVNRLTPRQTEILELLAGGLGPKEIAEQLDVSPLTLRTHVQNILTKLGVHTKLEAVALAIRQGKITPTDRVRS
jgi:DNA-binding NarL/FixJ family response regulator